MKLLDYKKKILKQIDDYDESLAPSYTDDEDILNRFNDVIDKAVKFAFVGKSHLQKWDVVCGKPSNMIANQEFLYTHMDEDIVFTVPKAYSYYFEVDGNCTVTISEDGAVLETIVLETTEWLAQKDVIDWGGGNITMTFGGDGYYNIQNIALYGAKFDTIPDFSVWTKHPIPANLYQIRRVVDANGGGVDYRIVGRDLLLQYNVSATVESIYYPDTITADTDDDTEIVVPIEIESIIIDKASAFLTQKSNDYDSFTLDADVGMQNLDGRTAHSVGRVVKLFDI